MIRLLAFLALLAAAITALIVLFTPLYLMLAIVAAIALRIGWLVAYWAWYVSRNIARGHSEPSP